MVRQIQRPPYHLTEDDFDFCIADTDIPDDCLRLLFLTVFCTTQKALLFSTVLQDISPVDFVDYY